MDNGHIGQQILLKPETLKILFTKSQDQKDYALLWWLTKPLDSKEYEIIRAEGWGGQYISVFPRKGLIAVRTKDPYSIDEAHQDVQKFKEFRDLIARWE